MRAFLFSPVAGVLPRTLLAACALVAACAAPGARSGARECRAELVPGTGSLSELADSSALQAAVERHWEPGTELAVATLRWDSAGVLAEPRVLSTHLSPVAVASMKDVLTEAVRGRPGAGSGAYLVLGAKGVPDVRRVARLGMCAPLFLNREEMTGAVKTREPGTPAWTWLPPGSFGLPVSTRHVSRGFLSRYGRPSPSPSGRYPRLHRGGSIRPQLPSRNVRRSASVSGSGSTSRVSRRSVTRVS